MIYFSMAPRFLARNGMVEQIKKKCFMQHFMQLYPTQITRILMDIKYSKITKQIWIHSYYIWITMVLSIWYIWLYYYI
jgi:hypothetical protein